VVGDRYLGLVGAPATRDLGGYTTVDGQRVRWGALFRSDGLARLTAGDRSALAALGLPGTCPAPPRAGRDAPAAPRFVTERDARSRDAAWLRRLARGSGAAWSHCDAGGDRRGWPTALLLATLGVPRETIVADHLLTNRPPPGGATPARPVTRASVDTAFEAVIARYGTFARYLERGLRLDPATVAALWDRFLADR
jgi:protein-tyrosine phosphatase